MRIPLSRTLPGLSRLPPLLRRPPLPKSHLSQSSRRTYTAPVLAKPTKFTPPSHPPSPPHGRDPINYPGPPTHRDPAKRYPNTMPPPNTWSYYFLTSRVLHFYISISVLVVLGAWAAVMNFLRATERGRELEGELSWSQPLDSVKRFIAAYRLHAHERTLLVAEVRRRKAEDADKRRVYRRAHGLERAREGRFGGREVGPGAEPEKGSIIRRALDTVTGVKGNPTSGEGGWVEEEIRRAEEEVEVAVAAGIAAGTGAAEEAVAAPTKEVKEEKKKGSWWSRG
ncbi:unnamed protein product [Tuber aestivum]|uniref:Uncharacterized protein n=1 Tax=Tuber aestivum TaxID=59557 RepID=A0A292PUY5_9PEZI|nr:unnamed protein product [Tuber aestivum]